MNFFIIQRRFSSVIMHFSCVLPIISPVFRLYGAKSTHRLTTFATIVLQVSSSPSHNPGVTKYQDFSL
ncbi:MAG: hypothetical protein E7118_04320 [Bacteroidales bacterium]|nr:hypothetical protein [Bacteroidales bacterium]